ncbi:F-box domain containing protein [Tanacetum coccineum]
MIFPLSLFNSKSLRHLTLNSLSYNYVHRLASTWELPALTTLHLYNVALFGHNTGHETSLFSKCVNLKNLTLRDCCVGGRGLRICLSQLSDLTLINLLCKRDCLDVVAPQLKNLTLKNYYVNPRICAPGLASLSIHQDHSTELISEDGFRSLVKADLHLRYPCPSDTSEILGHIQLLHNVKFLTLNLQIIQVLIDRHRIEHNENVMALLEHYNKFAHYVAGDLHQKYPKSENETLTDVAGDLHHYLRSIITAIMTGVAPPSSPAWHRHHHRPGTVTITGVAPLSSPSWHRHHHRRHALTIVVVTFTVFTPSPIQIYQS